MLIFNTLTLIRTYIINIMVSITGVKLYWFTSPNPHRHCKVNNNLRIIQIMRVKNRKNTRPSMSWHYIVRFIQVVLQDYGKRTLMSADGYK